MSYANPLMLLGLGAILVPVILHLITQHQAKSVDWGAMRFLMESVVHRSRRMLLEQILLLVVRCILIALVAVALALPFVPPGSRVPWPFVLPTVFLGAVALGAATALGRHRKWQWATFGAAAFFLGLALVATVAQRWLGVGVKPSGGCDVAIVIDASESMDLVVDGTTNLQRAIDEAGAVVNSLSRADAACIVIAGARQQVEPPTPTSQPEQLKKVLANLKPAGGMMSAREAFAGAVSALERGDNVGKKIVMITDGQSAGWKKGAQVDWDSLAAPLTKLLVKPTVVLRQLALPKRIDNVRLAELSVPGAVVGPERDLPINVRVENTGTEPMREAFDVELTIDDNPSVLRQSVSDLQPGASASLTFYHRFKSAGLHSVVARAARRDDLMWDNISSCVLRSVDRLQMLIIEGNPSARPRDRAGWFLQLALAPDLDEPASRQPTAPRTPAGKTAPSAAGESMPRSSRAGRLYAINTVDLPKVESLRDFGEYRVVVVADVPKLPLNVATALSRWVAEGGSLLVLPGSRCDASFYEQWQSTRGLPLLPAKLAERRIADPKGPAVHPLIGSLKHPALQLVSQAAQSDIGTATIGAYWRLTPYDHDETVQVAGTLDSGDPLLVERQLGRGRVLMTAMGLDTRSSNLPALQSFLPLVHEIVNYLMQLPESTQQAAPAAQLAIELPAAGAETGGTSERVAGSGSGLRACYFASEDFAQFAFERIDPAISFDWPAPPLADPAVQQFSVRWTGTLTPSASGKYRFSVDGKTTNVWLNGQLVAADAKADAKKDPTAPPVELVAGQPYAISVEHSAAGRQSKCRLLWQTEGGSPVPIPPESLSPEDAWRAELAHGGASQPNRTATMNATATGPSGQPVKATLGTSGNHLLIQLVDATRPGMYHVELPAAMRYDFRQMLRGEKSVPIAVKPLGEESQLAVLNDADLTGASPRVALASVASLDQLLTAISDQRSSYRLWRYLAVAALLLAIAEIALARWIAVQRQLGTTATIEFSPAASFSAVHSHALKKFSQHPVESTTVPR